MPRRNLLLYIVFIAVLALVLAMPSSDGIPDTAWAPSEFADVFPQRCAYLQRITEPIRIDHGNSYDDGGSLFIDIVDAKGNWFYACLKNDLEGDTRLTFAKPTPSMGIPVPVGGPEEREFLGMIERWALADQDSQYWIAKNRESRRRRTTVNLIGPEMTNDLLLKGVALSILNNLRKRNGQPRLW